jgi:hypothetical protein
MKSFLVNSAWRIYFLIWIALSYLIFQGYVDLWPNLAPRDLFDLFITYPLYLLAIFAFVFKKKILNDKFWRYFFWFSFVDLSLYGVYLESKNGILSFFYKSNIPQADTDPTLALILGILLISPIFYAIFRLGHPKPLDPSKRGSLEVLEDHLKLIQEGKVDEDIEKNYSKNAVIVLGDKTYKGPVEIKDQLSPLYLELKDAEIKETKKAEGEFVHLVRDAKFKKKKSKKGVESFLIKKGRIETHSIFIQ